MKPKQTNDKEDNSVATEERTLQELEQKRAAHGSLGGEPASNLH